MIQTAARPTQLQHMHVYIYVYILSKAGIPITQASNVGETSLLKVQADQHPI
mgnify:CR=1 FL=1